MSRTRWWRLVLGWQLALAGMFVYLSSQVYHQDEATTATIKLYGRPLFWWRCTENVSWTKLAIYPPPKAQRHVEKCDYRLANPFIPIAGLASAWSLPIVVMGILAGKFGCRQIQPLESRLWRISFYLLMSSFAAYAASLVAAVYTGWMTVGKVMSWMNMPVDHQAWHVDLARADVTPEYWIVTLLGLIVGWLVAMWAIKKHTRVRIHPTDSTV